MSAKRFEPSIIKNKIKREEVTQKQRKAKSQRKLAERLERAKLEAKDPALKQVGYSSSAFFKISLTLLI
jgi:ribosome production factor 1